MAASGLTDSQRETVYRWESEFPYWSEKRMDEADCVRAIEWACGYYKIPVPKITFHSNRKGYSWSQGFPEYHISLQQRGMNAATCLHEVAHLVHDYITGPSTASGHEGHGPEWLAIYMWLLIKSGILSKRATELSIRDIGLKWVEPMSLLSPRRIRKTYKQLYKQEQLRQKESLNPL